MRNLWIALVAACLSAGAAAGLGAQAHAGHAHDLADGMELHQGDLLWYRGEREIGRNQVIEGDVVVAGASLTVRGEVHGDAVVGGGDLVLEPGAVIYGDAVVTGGTLVNRGGSVLGKVQEGGPTRRADGTNAIHVKPGLITGLGAGWAGLVGTLVLGVVLCALGGALAVYGRPYLEQASDVIRRAPLDAATVGLSANVLALPVFLGGALALTLTLVGHPLPARLRPPVLDGGDRAGRGGNGGDGARGGEPRGGAAGGGPLRRRGGVPADGRGAAAGAAGDLAPAGRDLVHRLGGGGGERGVVDAAVAGGQRGRGRGDDRGGARLARPRVPAGRGGGRNGRPGHRRPPRLKLPAGASVVSVTPIAGAVRRDGERRSSETKEPRPC
jgi:hypothetical protein